MGSGQEICNFKAASTLTFFYVSHRICNAGVGLSSNDIQGHNGEGCSFSTFFVCPRALKKRQTWGRQTGKILPFFDTSVEMMLKNLSQFQIPPKALFPSPLALFGGLVDSSKMDLAIWCQGGCWAWYYYQSSLSSARHDIILSVWHFHRFSPCQGLFWHHILAVRGGKENFVKNRFMNLGGGVSETFLLTFYSVPPKSYTIVFKLRVPPLIPVKLFS